MTAPRERVANWRAILLEAVFVVLGVVLALAANEWRESASNRREATTALRSVREELGANRATVLESATYHIAISDSLFGRMRRPPADAEVPDARLFSRGFIHPARVLHTAWDAATATEAIRHMRHRDVLTIARIYALQENYAKQGEIVGTIIYNNLFEQGTGGIVRNYRNLASIVSTFWYRECELLLSYDSAMARLGEAGTAAAAPAPQRCSMANRR